VRCMLGWRHNRGIGDGWKVLEVLGICDIHHTICLGSDVLQLGMMSGDSLHMGFGSSWLCYRQEVS
jgi:hypothetical protein